MREREEFAPCMAAANLVEAVQSEFSGAKTEIELLSNLLGIRETEALKSYLKKNKEGLHIKDVEDALIDNITREDFLYIKEKVGEKNAEFLKKT